MLLGQVEFAGNVESCAHNLRAGIGLTAANEDRVLAFGDDGFAGIGDHAQVARMQVEVDSLRCAGVKVDALEAAQSAQRGARNLGEFEIELGHFVAGQLAGIGDGYVEGCIASGGNCFGWSRKC